MESELRERLRPFELLPQDHSSSDNSPPVALRRREDAGRSDGDDASAGTDVPPLVAVAMQASSADECLAVPKVGTTPSTWLPPLPVQNQESELLVVAPPARVESPCGLDVASPLADTRLTDDHDDGFEPIPSVRTNENAGKEGDVGTEGLLVDESWVGGIPTDQDICQPLIERTIVGTCCSSEDGDANHDNNLLLQLGGGLAVLGAVLGSAAAVAMMQGDRDRSSSRKSDAEERREVH